MFSKSSSSVAAKGHQQLTGDQADEQDRIIAGIQFNVRYVGSTEVAGFNGTGSGKTEIPVAQIFQQQKQKGENKNSRKMVMTLCSKLMSVSEEGNGRLVANFPIAKVTFCNVDVAHERAFVFIARDSKEAPFKLFVFQCDSKSKAREAFKALTLAFMINYESVQASRVRHASNSARGCTATVAEKTALPESSCSTAISDQGKENHCARKDGMDGVRPFVYFPPGCFYGGAPLQGKQSPELTEKMSHASYADFDAVLSDGGVGNSTNRPGGSVCGDDDFDAEFTQFAELRSRSGSDDTDADQRFPVTSCQGFDGEALGGFKTACLPMH